jgi:hypothetical protein
MAQHLDDAKLIAAAAYDLACAHHALHRTSATPARCALGSDSGGGGGGDSDNITKARECFGKVLNPEP